MKMSDVFEFPLMIQDGKTFKESKDGVIGNIVGHMAFEEQTQAAAHAINNYDRLVETLETIAKWNDHTVEFAVDYGSNGVRDYYRNLAKVALMNAGEAK